MLCVWLTAVNVPVHGLNYILCYCRWRSHIILSRLPRESWPEMQLKCAAYEAFDKRRPDWGYRRTWLGDYLAQVKDFFKSLLTKFTLCV